MVNQVACKCAGPEFKEWGKYIVLRDRIKRGDWGRTGKGYQGKDRARR